MGFGTKEKLKKQAKYEKKNGKSKVKITMPQPKVESEETEPKES